MDAEVAKSLLHQRHAQSQLGNMLSTLGASDGLFKEVTAQGSDSDRWNDCSRRWSGQFEGRSGGRSLRHGVSRNLAI